MRLNIGSFGVKIAALIRLGKGCTGEGGEHQRPKKKKGACVEKYTNSFNDIHEMAKRICCSFDAKLNEVMPNIKNMRN